MDYSDVGIGAYLSPSRPVTPKAIVSIVKFGNGYQVTFQTPPPMPKARKYVPPPNPLAGYDPDEIIDHMVDGMGALIRSINDKGAGEDWKNDEDRAKIREAFKVMFPGVSRNIQDLTDGEQNVATEPEPELRNESLVFESKEALLKYLTENL